jgi:hypothetical protein
MPGMPYRYESTERPTTTRRSAASRSRLGEDSGLHGWSQEKLTVNDVLDLLVLHYQDEHQAVPPGISKRGQRTA